MSSLIAGCVIIYLIMLLVDFSGYIGNGRTTLYLDNPLHLDSMVFFE